MGSVSTIYNGVRQKIAGRALMDVAFSSNSTNGVQNKVIKAKFDEIEADLSSLLITRSADIDVQGNSGVADYAAQFPVVSGYNIASIYLNCGNGNVVTYLGDISIVGSNFNIQFHVNRLQNISSTTNVTVHIVLIKKLIN